MRPSSKYSYGFWHLKFWTWQSESVSSSFFFCSQIVASEGVAELHQMITNHIITRFNSLVRKSHWKGWCGKDSVKLIRLHPSLGWNRWNAQTNMYKLWKKNASFLGDSKRILTLSPGYSINVQYNVQSTIQGCTRLDPKRHIVLRLPPGSRSFDCPNLSNVT